MAKLRVNSGSLVGAIRWTARMLGAMLLLLVMALAIGEGLPDPLMLSSSEALLMTAFVVMLLGLIAAWRWEGFGGLLILTGFVFFAAVEFIASGDLRMGWVTPAFPLVGLLYVLCWWRIRKQIAGRPTGLHT